MGQGFGAGLQFSHDCLTADLPSAFGTAKVLAMIVIPYPAGTAALPLRFCHQKDAAAFESGECFCSDHLCFAVGL